MSKAGRKKQRRITQSTGFSAIPLQKLCGPGRRLSEYGWLPPLLLALGVNANALFNGYAWDDALFFVQLPEMVKTIEGPAITPEAYFRPLINWSFQLDKAIWGLNPFGFHLSVYLGHAATTLLFYLCALFLARLHKKEESIALLAASLFAVHPIHAEAVAWISGRTDVFMALFVLIALYAYLRYRQKPSWVMLLIFGLGSVLGLLSKETAIPFLLMVPVLDFLFHRSGIIHRRGLKDPVIWVWAMVMGSFLMYRILHVGLPPANHGDTVIPGNGIIMFLAALGFYLKLLFIPHPLNLFVAEVPRGIIGGIYLTIGLAGIVSLCWVLYQRSRTLAAVGALWFILGSVAPLAVPFVNVSITPVAERYAYLASGGFFLLLSLGLFEGRRLCLERLRIPINAPRFIAGIVLVLGSYAYLTIERNGVWRDEKTVWEDAVIKSPIEALPHNSLGNAYRRLKRMEDAVDEYRMAIQLKPNNVPAHFNLGNVYAAQGRFEEATQAYRTALNLQPESAATHFNLATAYEDQGRWAEAIEEYQAVLRLNPDFPLIQYTLGNAYSQVERLEEATEAYQAALKFQPDSPEIYYNLGNAYNARGKTEEAIRAYEAASKIRPDYAKAHYNLGNVYGIRGQIEKAAEEYKAAIRIEPDFAHAHNNLGNAFMILKQPEEAIREYRLAIKYKPDLAQAHKNLGRVYKQLGRIAEARWELEQTLKLTPNDMDAYKALATLPK